MLDYAALSALAAVIREGSFERAARALHVTPSAVSQRVRLLEERVGCALVVRDQPCRPTLTGRRLCQQGGEAGGQRFRLLGTVCHECLCQSPYLPNLLCGIIAPCGRKEKTKSQIFRNLLPLLCVGYCGIIF